MKKNSKIFALLSTILPLFWGCNSFLEVGIPTSELPTSAVFASNSTANAAMTSIFARIAAQSGAPFSNVAWLTGLSSDEFINYSTAPNVSSFYTNSLTPSNTMVAAYFWTPYYNMIYQANAIIEGLEKNDLLEARVARQIDGEARFIRAFYHFYLTNIFGDIPIITSTDYRLNAIKTRNTQEQVYQQIVADLKQACNLLDQNYFASDGKTISVERVRPNLATAQALLARVYLFIDQYEEAERLATAVIENQAYYFGEDLNGVFKKNNPEAIWQVQPAPNQATSFAGLFVLSGAPSIGLQRSVALNHDLLNLFEPNDHRLTKYIGTISVQNQMYSFVSKHKVTVSNSTEYTMIIRLSELYLIRAESRIRSQKIVEGLADINRIRKRSGATEYDIEALDTDLASIIEKERVLELFGEGHRWFDLRRTGRINEIMTDATKTKGGIWDSHAQLFPIPETERSANPNLSQNNGY